ENHAGYANESTNDSLVEGFAEFVAMLIAEHYGAGTPFMYPVYQTVKNLEEDYKVWGESVFLQQQPENGTLKVITVAEPSKHEELAIAGILWDLHDSGSEVNPRHVIGQDGKGQDVWASTSKIYPDSSDNVSLSGEQILQVISNKEPKTLFALYQAFKSSASAQQLDMIFVNHGAFGDVVDRNLVQDLSGEDAGPTGHTTERLIRGSAAPALPGSYLSSNVDATIRVTFAHDDPFINYDYSYTVDMTSGEPTYFEMPPSYYPSKALIESVSADGRTISNVSVIDSHQYWKYIHSNPAPDGIFSALQISGNPPATDNGASGVVPETSSAPKSGCLIATAAFGSELAPQVQFLRNFRDDHILATASGSSFMTAFNVWYYSFSPQLADYERQQPWFQQTVRIMIYPLLGILEIAEKAYAIIPGEYGSIAAGLVTSSFIGAVYVSPIAISIKQVRKNRLDYRIALLIVGAISLSVIASLSSGSLLALTLTSSILVLSTMVLTALALAKFFQNLVERRKR
ncbi:MAG TPA: CFI-box-CTERM domain-containing protein, partial [Nitrososphaera sp.]|nr:CFI-box-CTERM domain-containing protein [Nitrososphaera sp.]